MLDTLIIILGVFIIMLVVIYKLGQWDNFTTVIRWIFSRTTKTKKQKKDTNNKPYIYCPYCANKITTCPFCNETYCPKCEKERIELLKGE